MQQNGFSLLELLLATALSFVVFSAIFACYASSKKIYLLNEALARMQENGRLAAYWLRRDIQMAGYIGCPRLSDVPLEINNFSTETRLLAWHAGLSTSNYPLPIKQTEKNSDILFIQAMSFENFNGLTVSPNEIQFPEAVPFVKNDWLVISDCDQAEIFQAAKVNRHILIPQLSLLHKYEKDAQIGQWHRWVYYVKKTDRLDTTGNPIYALYRRDLNASANLPSELIEGVNAMQILFDLSDKKHITADQIDDWKKIQVVHIALLLDSLVAVNNSPKSIVFENKVYSNADRHLLREWDINIALREPT